MNAQTMQYATESLEVSTEASTTLNESSTATVNEHQTGSALIDPACTSPVNTCGHNEFWELVNGLIEEGPEDEELTEAIAGLDKIIRTKKGTDCDAVKCELNALRYVQRLRSAQDAATKPKMAKDARVPTSWYRPETTYATVVEIKAQYISLEFPEYPDIEDPDLSTC